MDILENIVFKKLNKNDKKLFISLRLIFLMDCFDTINDTERNEIENNLKTYFDSHINKKNFIRIVGEYNGNIVSTVYLIISVYPANPNLVNGKVGTLLNVYTFPKYRKKGIAKKFIEEIIKETKLIGIDCMDLKATEKGHNLYIKLGFKKNKDKGMGLKI